MSQQTAEIKTYTPEEIAEILGGHKKWENGEASGIRANLDGANLNGANLYGANLNGANLVRANLVRANLDGANLDGANLDGANLDDANLYGANLDGANLDGANLDGANLDGANLVRANLYGANLNGANLNGANLDGAKYGEELLRGVLLIGPIGSRKSTVQVFGVGAAGFIFRAGCFTGTLEEFEAKVTAEHGDNQHAVQYRHATEFARQMLRPGKTTAQEAQA